MAVRRLDFYLFAMGVFLILVSSYRLFFKTINEAEGFKLGTLTTTLSVVKIKKESSFDWKDGSIGTDLTENQLIYTFNSSSASVKFLKGHDLEIGENSLVRLKATGEESGMEVEKGLIRAKIQGDGPLKIKMNGQDYLLSGKDADLQINIQDSKGEIGVLSGEVSLEADGKSEKINSSTALIFDGGKVSRKSIYYQFHSTTQVGTSYVQNTPSPITFSWTPAEDASLIVSQNISMAESKKFHMASGESIPLGEGIWYFRLESEKGISLVRTLRIVQERPPILFRPLNREKILRDNENSPVTLEWKNEAREKMKIEWDDGEIHTSEVFGNSLILLPQARPLLRWRARVDLDHRPHARWTDWQEVAMEITPPPAVPDNIYPHNREYELKGDVFPDVELRWQGVGNFEIEIKTPEEKIIQLVPHGMSQAFTPKLKGVYSWRIRAVDDRLRKSSWSGWMTFSMVNQSRPKPPEVQRRQLVDPNEKVLFTFPPALGPKRVFELSQEESFNKIDLKVTVENDSVSLRFPAPGNYYWRIREFRADGTIDVGLPVKVIIEPVPPPERPERLPDMEVPLEDLPEKTSWLDFFLPRAYAAEQGLVKINLPTKGTAKAYLIRIYQDEKLSRLILEKKLTSKEFIWKNAINGTFYWQYAVVDFWDRTSSFSQPSRLRIMAPEIKNPEKPKLIAIADGSKVLNRDLNLAWTGSPTHDFYLLEVSLTPDFKNILTAQETKIPKMKLTDSGLRENTYYWKVTAYNKKKVLSVSEVGSFVIAAGDPAQTNQGDTSQFVKNWKNRFFILWNPSQERYEFKDKLTGKGSIGGNVVQSGSLIAAFIKGKTIYNGEFLRQAGVVSGGQKYFFQRIGFDVTGIFWGGRRHLSSLGVALAQSEGRNYSAPNGKLQSDSQSGSGYGFIFRNSFAWNKSLETQLKLQYLLGPIKQLEFGGDLIFPRNHFLFLMGASFFQRTYVIGGSVQTSLRLSLGLGKEF